MDLSLIIPCYNEEANLDHVLPNVLSWAHEKGCRVICVNDGSSDKTWEILNRYAADPHLLLLKHRRNKGYGGALKTGISHCQTRYCVTFDADGQHDLGSVEKLYHAILEEDADLCVGDRQFKGSSFTRNMAKKMIIGFTKLFVKIDINDLNSGMKMYLTESAQKVVPHCPDGMSFSDIVLLSMENRRMKIIERPIVVHPRKGGISTINYKTAIETASEITYLIINIFPFRFFALVSFLLFLAALAWAIPFILKGEGLTNGASFLFFISLILVLNGITLENINRIMRNNK